MRCDKEPAASLPNPPAWTLWVFIPVMLIVLIGLGSFVVRHEADPPEAEPTPETQREDAEDGCDDPCAHVCGHDCPPACEIKIECEVQMGGACVAE